MPSAELLMTKFRNNIRLSNSLDPDQVRRSVGHDLVLNVCKGYQQTTLVGKEFFESPQLSSGKLTDNSFWLYFNKCVAVFSQL